MASMAGLMLMSMPTESDDFTDDTTYKVRELNSTAAFCP